MIENTASEPKAQALTTVTVAYAASYIGRSARTVYRLIENGDIAFRRVGRRVFPLLQDLQAWLDKHPPGGTRESPDDNVQPNDRKAARKEPRCFTDLIDQIIRDQGFSVREAKTIRKAIFESWARALRRGEIVETPLGEMQVVRAPKRRPRFNRLNKKLELVIINRRERHIVFRPWPGLVETLPTTFYQEADAALLEKLGRKPWATSGEQHEENVQAIKAAIAARSVPAPPPIEDFRKAMSPAQIAARAQRPLSDFFPPPPPPGRRWGR